MNTPTELLYSKEHEWVRIEGDIAVIGITDYAQSQLGDIVYVDVATIGETLDIGRVFGAVEAVKTVSDLYMPVSGQLLELNPAIDATPELVNHDPYGQGWMIKVKMGDPKDTDSLLSAAQYKQLIG